MIKQFLIIFTFLPLISFGQPTKLIKDKVNNEEYYVLKSNNSIKHGEYHLFNSHKTLLINGHYKNGVQDSIWDLYDTDGVLFQKINISNNELIYVKIEDSEKNNLYKQINGAHDSLVVLDRPPVFPGGIQKFLEEWAMNIQYPEDAFNKRISGRVFVSFIIDKYGKMSNFKILKSAAHGLDEEAIRALKSIPDYWFPGILNGNAVDIEVSYPISFKL